MHTRAFIAMGVIGSICLSFVAFPAWSAPQLQAQVVPADTLNAPSPSSRGKDLHVYAQEYLTPERALELALRYNPRLETFSSAVEESTHLLKQAGRLPNPELELELENFGGSGEFRGGANAEASVRVQQRLELGGKRQHRMAAAQSAIKLEKAQQRAYTTALEALVRKRIIEFAQAQEQLKLTLKQEQLSQALLDMVRQRIDAGKAANIEQIAFEMHLSDAQLKSHEAQTEVERAKYALAALWGQSSPTFGDVVLNLEQLPEHAELEDLYPALAHTPATVIARTQAQLARKKLRLEQSNRIPDLHVSVGAKEERSSGDHALIGGIGMEIPIFNRNQDGVAAANARREHAEAGLRTSMVEQRHALQEVWHALENIRAEEHALRTQIIPAAQKHFDAVTYAYRAGKYTYLRVLDAQQNLFELRRRHIDALGGIQRRHVELQRICGTLDSENEPGLPETTSELASVTRDGDR